MINISLKEKLKKLRNSESIKLALIAAIVPFGGVYALYVVIRKVLKNEPKREQDNE